MPRAVSRRALTLPARALKIIKEYKAFNNLQLRAAVREYFENRVLCELRHGKINTWDVSHVTDMSSLFANYSGGQDPRACPVPLTVRGTQASFQWRYQRLGRFFGDDDVGHVHGVHGLQLRHIRMENVVGDEYVAYFWLMQLFQSERRTVGCFVGHQWWDAVYFERLRQLSSGPPPLETEVATLSLQSSWGHSNRCGYPVASLDAENIWVVSRNRVHVAPCAP